MAIWTSRYSNKELQSGNYYTVGISLGKPKFQLGYQLRKQCYDLAPDRWMWGKEFDEFRRMYFAKLDKIGIEKVKGILESLHNEAEINSQDLVLLCFEDVRDPEDWCHRIMLAEWVKRNIGIDIQELHNPEPIKARKKTQNRKEAEKKTDYQQLSLFDICNA